MGDIAQKCAFSRDGAGVNGTVPETCPHPSIDTSPWRNGARFCWCLGCGRSWWEVVL